MSEFDSHRCSDIDVSINVLASMSGTSMFGTSIPPMPQTSVLPKTSVLPQTSVLKESTGTDTTISTDAAASVCASMLLQRPYWYD